MRYVLTYHGVDDFAARAQEHGGAHVARLHEFAGRGVLLMAGPLDDPPSGDALGIFTSQDAAEEFVAGDPFVLHGVVESYSVRPWREILVGPRAL
jgi:uncharacterized protein YciI